jgi:hypothetical protein
MHTLFIEQRITMKTIENVLQNAGYHFRRQQRRTLPQGVESAYSGKNGEAHKIINFLNTKLLTYGYPHKYPNSRSQ